MIYVVKNIHHVVLLKLLFMPFVTYKERKYIWYWTDIVQVYMKCISIWIFSVLISVSLHVIIYLIDIQIIDDSIYNVQFNIWYSEKSDHVKLRNFWEHARKYFVLPTIVCRGISNPRICINMVMKEHGYL